MKDIISARLAFVQEYCAAKGWNESGLSWEQIMEIRDQEGWKNPVIEAHKEEK